MAETTINDTTSSNPTIPHIVLGLGGLFTGTGEFAAMGLLPDLAQSVDISIPQAGNLISAYALGVVIGSPVLAVLTARMEKRRILVLLAFIVLVGNTASALAGTYLSLAAARFLSGLPHGAYYGTAAIVAASIVPKEKRTQAIGRVMLGLAAANLAGVPLITYVGHTFGWRMGFYLIAAGGALLAVLLPLAVPKVEADKFASPLTELSGMLNVNIWMTLATAAIGFGGMFAVYSYITPTLTELTGQSEGSVPVFLSLWGLGMIFGNVVGSWFADRNQTRAIIGMMIWNIVFLALFVPAAHSAVTVATVLFLIGVGFGLVPALQARLMDVAPNSQSLAGAMNHSAFNLSNAIGAWTGGLALDAGLSWSSTGGVGAALAFAGLLIFFAAIAIQKRSAA